MQTDDATTGGLTEAITTLLPALEHFLQWTSPERTARERAVWSAQLDNSGCCSRMWRSIFRHWLGLPQRSFVISAVRLPQTRIKMLLCHLLRPPDQRGS